MDIAVNLVENYLRLTGYLTVAEFEVQRRDPEGRYKTVTDIDVMGIRLPGATSTDPEHETQDCALLHLDDPVLGLTPDTVDVVIGEVKQGSAELNPGIKDHAVLHSTLRRVEWLYGEPVVDVVASLQQRLVHSSPGRTGGRVRTRIVAFGRSDTSSETVIALNHIITTLVGFFEANEEAFHSMQFREPAPAFLRLLAKTGFEIDRSPSE